LHGVIGVVGLYRTEARSRFATMREDSVKQMSAGLFGQMEYQWNPVLRTTMGLRGDVYRFAVGGPPYMRGLASPKLSAVFGPWSGTEVYANAGYGFHSNDARTVLSDDSTPLVRARGAEIGLRTVGIPHVQSTVSLWRLGLDSELVFAGDAGSTEASRPSRRVGIEWATYASPRRWLAFDGDVALSRATFTDVDPAGDRIPGSVQTVISLGVSIHDVKRLSGSVRLRHFGPRPLIEDDSVRSSATSLLSAQAGYRIGSHSRVVVELFNLLNEMASDIDYFYTSRLRDEPSAGIADIHTHPALPRGLRATMQVNF
jgi:outer membrane receptor protein involved in Fe transport